MFKLTAVTIYFNGRNHTRFLWLKQNPCGKGAVIPETVLNSWLNTLNVRRGQTYSIG